LTGSGAFVSGRYQLQRKLDDADNATTWEANDTALERRVLVKLLRADLTGDPAAVEGFRRAARAAAQAASAFGSRVLDAGDDQTTDVPFVVFEWREESPDTMEERPDHQAQATAHRLQAIAIGSVPPPGRVPRSVERLVLLLLAVPVVVGALVINNWVGQPTSVGPQLFSLPAVPAAATPAPSTVALSRQSSVAGTKTPQPRTTVTNPPPTPTPAPESLERRRIANTDGIGVALRASPGGERLAAKGYDEGVTVTLLEQRGAWAHIRGDDGREGWVLAVTLVR